MVCGFDGQIRTNIARNIIQKTKTYPSIIYTSETETYCNNKFFNNSFIIDSFKLRQGIFNDNFFLENSIDKNLYFELSKLERLICYNLEDTTGFNFSYKQRLNYFYDLLLHTTNLLKKYKPNLIIFWTLPHTSENVVLYQIAKKLKIKTLFMEHIFQIKRVGFFSSIDGFPNNFIKNTNIKKSSKLFNLYYQNIINSRNDKHIRTYNKKFKFSFFKELILYLIYFFHKKLIMAYKINKLTFGKHSVMRIRHLHFFNLRAFVSNVLIYKYYENLCKNFKINLNDKYIIFFSSFQPEASTYIHSEYYDNQEYALRMLNDILPSNYKIYYKEYPKNNLHKHSKLFLSRNREYYQRLSKAGKDVVITKIIDKLDNLYLLKNNTNEKIKQRYILEIKKYIMPLVKKNVQNLYPYFESLIEFSLKKN